jgi:hypothetical protein
LTAAFARRKTLRGWNHEWFVIGILPEIFENKPCKTAICGVLLGMSKKRILLVMLCLVGTLVMLAMMLPASPTRTKKHGTRIQAVNSIGSISFTLTNSIATNRLPVSKP